MAYKYEGFWRAMDTLRDRQILEDMIEKGNMPWRTCGPRGGADCQEKRNALGRLPRGRGNDRKEQPARARLHSLATAEAGVDMTVEPR
jgi:hypothetical protein